MPAQDPAELLENTETAINAVLNGQAYRIGDRTFTRANLAELQALRRELKNEVAQQDGQSPTVSYFNISGSA